MPRRQKTVFMKKEGGVEVLLAKDVPNLGRAGDLVTVRPGYARNYLIPYGFAVAATPANVKRVEKYRERLAQLEAERRRALEKLADQIAGMEIHVEAAANELGHLYGSVGPNDIVEALRTHGIAIEPDMVRLEGVIKQTGLYTVKVQLAPDIDAELSLWVVPLGDVE